MPRTFIVPEVASFAHIAKTRCAHYYYIKSFLELSLKYFRQIMDYFHILIVHSSRVVIELKYPFCHRFAFVWWSYVSLSRSLRSVDKSITTLNRDDFAVELLVSTVENVTHSHNAQLVTKRDRILSIIGVCLRDSLTSSLIFAFELKLLNLSLWNDSVSSSCLVESTRLSGRSSCHNSKKGCEFAWYESLSCFQNT